MPATQRLLDRRILIVDDDEDIRSSVGLVLRAEGAETTAVGDGNTAVSMMASFRPHIVILDMMLPGRSGFLVLEKIREHDDSPPVVMITANRGKRHQVYATDLGVNAYLVKPVALQHLLDTIVQLLDSVNDDE